MTIFLTVCWLSGIRFLIMFNCDEIDLICSVTSHFYISSWYNYCYCWCLIILPMALMVLKGYSEIEFHKNNNIWLWKKSLFFRVKQKVEYMMAKFLRWRLGTFFPDFISLSSIDVNSLSLLCLSESTKPQKNVHHAKWNAQLLHTTILCVSVKSTFL